jgi:hypothetical protein
MISGGRSDREKNSSFNGFFPVIIMYLSTGPGTMLNREISWKMEKK